MELRMMSTKKIVGVFLLFMTVLADDSADKKYNKVSSSPSLQDEFKGIVDAGKKVFDGGKNMLEGMGQSFGYVSSDYQYSYRVFNDAPSSIFVATEQLTEFLGAGFRGQVKTAALLGPNANTDDEFYNQQLYLTVFICGKTKDLNDYEKNPSAYLQKYGGIAGKLHVSGKGSAAANIPLGILKTAGTDLGAVAGGIINIVEGGIQKGLQAIQSITGLDVGADQLSDPLERYALLSKTLYPPMPEDDDKVYYYHAYAHYNEKDQKFEKAAEYLDLAGTTSEFSGQFYNHSSKNIALQFTKDGKPYTVTLEPETFNLLQSSKDVDYSIRPQKDDAAIGFQFYNGTVSAQNSIAFIPVSSEGIGNVISTQQDPKKMVKKDDLVVVGPKLYTYEVVDTPQGLAVGVQGLKIGNFDQPVTQKVRDINPAVCHLWFKDAKAAQAEMEKNQQGQSLPPDYNAIAFDIPEQVWVKYKTADYILQEKVTTGTVKDFYVIRPQIQEKEAWLYVVTVQTDDDAKAKKFLDRLSAGTIGTKAIYTDVTKEELDKKTVLNMQPNSNGFIDDTQGTDASGVTGAVVLADWFAPQGVGSGPFYYELDPGVLRIDQFANAIWYDPKFYAKDEKTGALQLASDVLKELATLLPQWIDQYKTSQEGAQAALKKYLQEKGNAGDPKNADSNGIFVNAKVPPAQREFTEQGKNLLKTLIDGPISLKNYPIMRKAGTNWYTRTLGDKPESWPQ